MLDECASGWQATQKPEMLAGRMCQWLADNTKISHKRELIMLRYYNSLFNLKEHIYEAYIHKKEALRIVIATAKEYQRKLEGFNYLFIYRDRKSNNVDFFETVFLPRNFLHLTGIEYVDSEGRLQNKAIDFYNKCTKNLLTEDEIKFKADGTTPLKLQALPKLVNFL